MGDTPLEKPKPKDQNTAADGSKIDPEDQLKKLGEDVEGAMDKVGNTFKDLLLKVRTSMADFNKSVIEGVLKMPLVYLQKEMADLIKSGKAIPPEKMEELQKRLKTAEEFAVNHLKTIAADNGGKLGAEEIVRLTSDANRKASIFADKIISGKCVDLVQAYLYAIGSQGESKDMLDAGKKAKETVLKYLNENFKNKNSDLMQQIWTVLVFMKKEERIEIAKEFTKKDPALLAEFLKKGNTMGVYTGAEIQELTPDKKYNDGELAQFQLNWKTQNDLRAEISRISTPSYGSDVQFGENFLRDCLFGFLEFGAAASIVGTAVTGMWEGGKFKGPLASIKRMTKFAPIFSVAEIAAIEVFKSDKTWDQLFQGSDAKKIAARDLMREKNGNPKWPLWDRFFRQGKKSDGAQGFYAFMQYTKNHPDPKDPKASPETDLSNLKFMITPDKFKKFLTEMEKKKKEGDGGIPDLNYASIKASMKDLNPDDEEFLRFAKIFDTLNMGGQNAETEYAKVADHPEKKI